MSFKYTSAATTTTRDDSDYDEYNDQLASSNSNVEYGVYHVPYDEVVVSQPSLVKKSKWMTKPNPMRGCPAGLEYLMFIDKLHIHQKTDLIEAFIDWEANNNYVIKNDDDLKVFYAFEKSDVLMRQFCRSRRSFVMHIVDNANEEILRVTRQFKCCACCIWCACFNCCAHELKVELPDRGVLGYVKQTSSCFRPSYHILDENKNLLLKVQGPCCILRGFCCPCSNSEFKIIGANNAVIGKISKKFSGMLRETFTNADDFHIEFPVDLPVKVKALLIGAMFLIDFKHFEH